MQLEQEHDTYIDASEALSISALSQPERVNIAESGRISNTLALITGPFLYRERDYIPHNTMSITVCEIPATRTAEKCGRKRDF